MRKNKLIVKLLIECKLQKKEIKRINKIVGNIKRYFVSVGQPLNDNILKFNSEQLKWCNDVFEKLDTLTNNKKIQ